MERRFKAVYSEALSDFKRERYIIVDVETGEILDDAQGYGYKSKVNAYKSFGYRNKRKKNILQNHM